MTKYVSIIVVAASLAIFSSCADKERTITAPAPIVIDNTTPKGKDYGAYLAGRVAHLRKDFNSAADYYMQSLKNETDKKTRELASATLSMAKINEVLSETLTGIEQVRRTTRDSKSSALLLQIESKLRSLDYDERQWENFKLYFEQIHPLFFSRLSKAFPALTTGELRLCAFIVMNMTSKEIASVTNRSIRTIDSIKFRLRSKMSIPKETSTLAFLLAFTNDES